MTHHDRIPSELDDGNVFVYITKIEERIDQIQKQQDNLLRKIEILTEKAKDAINKSEISLTTATKVANKKPIQFERPARFNRALTKWPSYKMWADYLLSIYAPVDRKEFDEMWLRRETIYSTDVRRELAMKFGQQMLDDNFIGQKSVTQIMSRLGFKVSVHRLMPNLDGWGTVPLEGAIMCKRIYPPEE